MIVSQAGGTYSTHQTRSIFLPILLTSTVTKSEIFTKDFLWCVWIVKKKLATDQETNRRHKDTDDVIVLIGNGRASDKHLNNRQNKRTRNMENGTSVCRIFGRDMYCTGYNIHLLIILFIIKKKI